MKKELQGGMNVANHGLADTLVIDIKDHQICFVLPYGSTLRGTLCLPGGAVISGDFEGSIECATGSIIFPKDSTFRGTASAVNIYVEGTVENPGPNRISLLQAKAMIAISNIANGRADMIARAFNINSKTFAGRIINTQD